MDLGIKGKKALLAASTSGLGLACATALAREGCIVYINGREAERLQKAQQLIALETGVQAFLVQADINTSEGRDRLIQACPDVDILVNNNAGPPPGTLADWDHAAWMNALEANLLAPVLLIRAVLPGMRSRRFGRIVNITSAMVKSPRASMSLSTTARTGLTAFSKAMSIEAAADNVTLNNLLPERIDTPVKPSWRKKWLKSKGSIWLKPAAGLPRRLLLNDSEHRKNLLMLAPFYAALKLASFQDKISKLMVVPILD